MKLDDGLLRYYTEELTYLRSMGREFARNYPKVADRLDLQDGHPADPHVERLIESFALLTGRIRHEMDAEFPQITSSLLGILYPQLTQPIPPTAIARFGIDAQRGKFTTGHLVPKHTSLFAYGSQGVTCRFRTCYPVTMWPVAILETAVEPPAKYDFLASDPTVASVLRLRIGASAGSLADLELNTLRFYLDRHAGPAYILYELLFSALTGIMLVPEGSGKPVSLATSALSPVGFADDDDIIPYPSHAHPGYRLIQEYFQFPEKFLFIDLNGLGRHSSNKVFDVLFLLKSAPRQRLHLSNETFALGCVPIANLFPRTTEPVRLDQRQLYYRVVPDIRREHTTEIHSIVSVSGSMNPLEETRQYQPFYSFRHPGKNRTSQTYWQSRRMPTGREDLPGTDVYLSFLDLDFQPSEPPSEVIFAHALCTNRWLATQIPPGAKLQMEDVGPVTVTCLNRPTPPVYPPLGGPTVWQLISNLSLNYLSLTGAEGRDGFREMLRLYCFGDQPSHYQQIQGIRDMATRGTTLRIGKDAWRGFCAGTEVTLTFDESLYVGGGAFLFATVLRHFLAMYASIESFTQLVARRVNREEEWMRWPPLAGRGSVL